MGRGHEGFEELRAVFGVDHVLEAAEGDAAHGGEFEEPASKNVHGLRGVGDMILLIGRNGWGVGGLIIYYYRRE